MLSHRYDTRQGSVHVLDNIDLTIEPGEFVILLGPSGCGKSTLLLLAAGLVAPTQGAVWIQGEEVTKPFTNSGFVFQDASLLDWRTALRNILLQAEARGIDRASAEAKARSLMQQTGISDFEDAYPSQLSGGMRQRVSICRALLHDPPILFMDEPFGALDAMTREQMVLDIQRIWMEGSKTVLFVTHDISEALLLADRIVVLGPRPGSVLNIYDVGLARPRSTDSLSDARANRLQHEIRELLRDNGAFSPAPRQIEAPPNQQE